MRKNKALVYFVSMFAFALGLHGLVTQPEARTLAASQLDKPLPIDKPIQLRVQNAIDGIDQMLVQAKEQPPAPAVKEQAGPANPQKFQRGLKPTPRHKIFAIKKHQITVNTLSQVAYVPKKLSMWGNNQYGDCVSASEAYNQAVGGKFLNDSTIIDWASTNGFLNGADLPTVMDTLAKSGFKQDGHTYSIGGYKAVDFSNEGILQNALSVGPVKIGIDANALSGDAGNKMGWVSTGGSPGQFTNEDHCVELGGFGTAAYLFAQLGVALPSGLDGATKGYLLFTWSTLGFIDHPWLMSTCSEAYVRDPCTTVDGVPNPNPGSGGSLSVTVTASQTVAAGSPATWTVGTTGGTAPYTQSWTYGDATTGSAPTHSYATAGTYTATVTVSDASKPALTGTATGTVTVTAVPPPPNPGTDPVPGTKSQPGQMIVQADFGKLQITIPEGWSPSSGGGNTLTTEAMVRKDLAGIAQAEIDAFIGMYNAFRAKKPSPPIFQMKKIP